MKQLIFDAQTGETVVIEVLDVEMPVIVVPKTELELLQEANLDLKARVVEAERVLADNSLFQQELLELLIDMEVI